MRATLRIGSLLSCVLVSAWACEPNECDDAPSEVGLLADTPRAALCTTDRLVFSPNSATLRSSRSPGQGSAPATDDATGGGDDPGTVGAGGAAPEPGGAVDELTMAVVAEDASGRPRDTVNLRIQVCGSQSLLDLAPADGEAGNCELLTSSQLQCATSASGVARFRATHGNRGGGRVELCALSRGKVVARSVIDVRDLAVEDLALRVSTDQLGFGPLLELGCDEAAAATGCEKAGGRSTTVRVAALDALAVEAPVATPQQVDLSVRDLSGRPGAVGLALDDCANASARVTTTLDAGASITDAVLLCVDAGRSTFELSASIPGSRSRTEQFVVAAAPHHVVLVEEDVAMGGAPAVAQSRIELRDCEDEPLANAPFVWRAGTGPAQVALTDALGGFSLPDVSGTVSVGVVEPQTNRVVSCDVVVGGGS